MSYELYTQDNINKFTNFLLNAKTFGGKKAFLDSIIKEDWKKLFRQVWYSSTDENSEAVEITDYNEEEEREILPLRNSFGFLYLYFLELDNFNILETMDFIPRYAFYNVTDSAIERLTIPDNIKEIDIDAFRELFSLKSINIGKGVEFINECAFMACENLEEVTIPSGSRLKSFGGQIFLDCNDLVIKFNGTLEQWKLIEQESSSYWVHGSGKITVQCIDKTFTI